MREATLTEAGDERYILFVDTEATGLPPTWDKPYRIRRNWPWMAQVAWRVYSEDGRLLKEENHFLKIPRNAMQASAQQVHGITPEYLDQNGRRPADVLQILHDDLVRYKPLVVGHYVRLDYHLLSAGFFRSGIENPLTELHTFCTMEAFPPEPRGNQLRYLRLGELYERLFHRELDHQHDAAVDARATAEAFFELRSQGRLTDALVQRHPQLSQARFPGVFTRYLWLWFLLMFASVLTLFVYFIYA